ncbi:cytochrome P450 [Hysterangium stoloniferum]|nr:cytochrome P450 [Hysterangium stoloniferum]
MSNIPPGARFCADIFKSFLLPPLLAHMGLRLISVIFAVHFSSAYIAAVWIFTLPIYLRLCDSYTNLIDSREARRLGAKLVPSVPGKWPGNIDLLYNVFLKKDLYPGDGVTNWVRGNNGTTFALSTLGETRLVTMNPENVKRVLATDFDNYVKGEFFNSTMQSVLGVGVFNSDGDMWQFHRKITRPFFARDRVTDFTTFDEKSNVAMHKMQDCFRQGHAIDFQDIVSRFTLDSACEFLLGTSIHSLEDPLPRPDDDGHLTTATNVFARAFANAQVTVASRGRLGMFWRLTEFFRDKTKEDMAIIKGYIEPIVKAAIDKRGGGNSTKGKEVILLDHLVNVTDDLKVIVDEVLNIMLAGRDTTASLLTFATYCLAMHPDVLARLREEVIGTVGKVRAPTLEDLRDMKYMRAVINETLRLFPPVPFNVRQSIKGTTFTDDDGSMFYIPPKTRVTWSIINMHRHEGYWGSDANVWDPDRFLDDRMKTTVTPNPFIFLPFNAGPRICLGQQFAYHEASFFIVRMLQRFDQIELATDTLPAGARPPASWVSENTGSPRRKIEKCWPKAHLTLYANGGLWLTMKEVNSETP